MRYDLAHDDVLECWLAEAYRVFGDVMVGPDRDKFDSVLWQVVATDWNKRRPDGWDSLPCFVSFNPASVRVTLCFYLVPSSFFLVSFSPPHSLSAAAMNSATQLSHDVP